jgi:hypothetical protein
MIAAWVESEFRTLDLRDKRRDRRVKTIVDQFAQVAESTPDACRDIASLEATYRIANNPAVSPDDILKAHHQASIERTAEHACVILAQDTTPIDMTKPNRQVTGAGPMEHEDHRGVFFHPLYAISEEGIPLGIVDHLMWARESIRTDLSAAEKQRLRKAMAFEEKESCRWVEMFQSGEQIARANPQTMYVNVSDSEADIFEMFLETRDMAPNHHFVVRGCQDRALAASANEDDDDESGERSTTTRHIDDALAAAEICYEATIEVSGRKSLIAGDTRPRRKSRTARSAKVEIRAATVTLRGPQRPGGKLDDVTINVVEVREVNPPAGEDPIRWTLLTSLPIETVEQIKRVVKIYCRRWMVELFFKTLKSGCRVEKLKYEHVDSYLTAVSMLIVVAWRIEYLKSAAREDPDASCEKYFSMSEWVPVYLVQQKAKKIPTTPPTISEFMLIVAKLGGYINRKGQGPPGSTTIWRGMQRMDTLIEAYSVFEEAEKRCVV